MILGVNNVHLPRTEVEDLKNNYLVCQDVSGQTTFVRKLKKDKLPQGYMYACTVDEFLQRTKIQITNLGAVSGLLKQ